MAARVRDTKAEYAARNQRAKDQGFKSYYAQRKAITRNEPAPGRRRVTTKEDEPPAEQSRFDLSPWAETPQSSRVSRYRYDYANRAVQVQWRNNIGHGYIYEDVPYEDYRAFVRVVSKGRFINTTLNNAPGGYRPMTVDEVNAPSNETRQLIKGRRS